ncbi:MAG: ABC transporter ATP-binding protein [Planctomycetes bacterium]|nr:ABC transporter ATP-binding protein [Planctomycetota bacterium]
MRSGREAGDGGRGSENTAAAPAVRLAGVTKRYGTGGNVVTALRGVDLDIAAGELLMLVGPSGCGKTTLISVASGILDHDDGECLVFGEDIKRLGDSARTAFRGRNIGFVFQAFNLLPTLSAAENVAIPLLIAGAPWKPSVARAEAMLERVGLSERGRALPSQLSGGQQQRVAIARALINEPRLLVCDEPTSALDHESGQKVMALLREVALGPERALVIVTHDSRIFPYADRIARMDDGRIARIERPGQAPGQ